SPGARRAVQLARLLLSRRSPDAGSRAARRDAPPEVVGGLVQRPRPRARVPDRRDDHAQSARALACNVAVRPGGLGGAGLLRAAGAGLLPLPGAGSRPLTLLLLRSTGLPAGGGRPGSKR